MTDAQFQSELRFRERMATAGDFAAVLLEEDEREAAILADATRKADLKDTQERLRCPGRLLTA
jgi:hypothetical protein